MSETLNRLRAEMDAAIAAQHDAAGRVQEYRLRGLRQEWHAAMDAFGHAIMQARIAAGRYENRLRVEARSSAPAPAPTTPQED